MSLLWAEGENVTGWLSVITNLGGMGFAGWMCYYLVTKWIPDLVDRFEKHLEKARTDFREEAKLQREHDSAQDLRERTEYNQRMADLKDHQMELKNGQEGLRAKMDSIYTAVREIRHGVNDVLHTRATVKAAQEARAKLPENHPQYLRPNPNPETKEQEAEGEHR